MEGVPASPTRRPDADPDADTESSLPTVRQAVEADLLEVVRIERNVFPQPWPYDAFRRFLDEPGFLVAVDDDRQRPVVGYVVADSVPNGGRTIGHVKDIAVHPTRQGAGIGSLLLRRSLAGLRARGAGRVKLEVRAGNERAIALYRRHGFAHTRTTPRYYDDGEDALVMVRSFD